MKAAIALIFSLEFIERLKEPLYKGSVLGVLAAIGAWGHSTHWTFAPGHGEMSRSNQRTVVAADIVPAKPRPGNSSPGASSNRPVASGDVASEGQEIPSRIEFPSPESVRALGIETAGPECRTVTREVTATAVVTYEPSRLAQLSARVAGTLWRLERSVGQSIRAGDVLAIIDAPAVGQAKADFLHAIADVELRKKAHDRLNSFAKGEVG